MHEGKRYILQYLRLWILTLVDHTFSAFEDANATITKDLTTFSQSDSESLFFSISLSLALSLYPCSGTFVNCLLYDFTIMVTIYCFCCSSLNFELSLCGILILDHVQLTCGDKNKRVVKKRRFRTVYLLITRLIFNGVLDLQITNHNGFKKKHNRVKLKSA